jgi:hypothetical protein
MSYTTPIGRLHVKVDSLLKRIRAYGEKIATESEGAPSCYRTEDKTKLKKAKHTGVGEHLVPAIETLIAALQACYPVIDGDRLTLTRIQTIEQHLGAIASNSDCTQGITSRFRGYYQELLTLVQQFKIVTVNLTDKTPLLVARAAEIPNPVSAGVIVKKHSFDLSRRLSQLNEQKILAWREHCAPLETQLTQFLGRTSPDDSRHHGVNNHLREAMRFTKIALDFYSIGGDTGTMSADENIRKAEQMLGAVASWSPYFRIPCGAVSSEFKNYYQSTCKLVEAAKAILPDLDYTRSRRVERPSIVPVTSPSQRNILAVVKRGSMTATGSFRSLFPMMIGPHPLSTELSPANTRDPRRADSVRKASIPPGSRSTSAFWSTSELDERTKRVSSPLYFPGTLLDAE